MSTHQHRLSRDRLRYMAVGFGLLVFSTAVQAKDKKIKAAPTEPRDAIEVVGHVPSTNRPVKRFLATQHYSSSYLYAEHDDGKDVTLIDVTKVTQPSVLADEAYPSNGGSGSLFAVAGTAVLVAEEEGPAAPVAKPPTIRTIDCADLPPPKV